MYSSNRSTVSGSSALLLRERRHLGRKVVDEGRLHEVVPRTAPRTAPPRCVPAPAAGLDRHAQPRRQRRRASRAIAAPPRPRSRRASRRAAAAAASRSDSRRNGAWNEMTCSPKGASRPPSAACAVSASICLGQRHQVAVVGVAPVELEHRELGVVLRRDPLVPEVTVDLEHSFDAADGQPLEVELGRDAQVERHVERVVMRRERPGQRAAGNRLHHRRLDLEEAARQRGTAESR